MPLKDLPDNVQKAIRGWMGGHRIDRFKELYKFDPFDYPEYFKVHGKKGENDAAVSVTPAARTLEKQHNAGIRNNWAGLGMMNEEILNNILTENYADAKEAIITAFNQRAKQLVEDRKQLVAMLIAESAVASDEVRIVKKKHRSKKIGDFWVLYGMDSSDKSELEDEGWLAVTSNSQMVFFAFGEGIARATAKRLGVDIT